MHLNIENRQQRFRVCRATLRQVVADLAALAAASRGARPWLEVTVLLTDDAGMAPLNLRIMRHAGSTDVITQRYEALPGEPEGVYGELLVNVERAWQVGGRRRDWSASRELALYIAHGCDHLNDADDTTPAGYQRMRRRELSWLRQIRVPDLVIGQVGRRLVTPEN
ncbi:MAG: rRNA maturation RNase YbeY [Kiritimatiellia bacterium]